MSLCDIHYFVPVLPALSSLPTLPGHVLGRCQKKSGQGQQSQLALGQLTLVPASAALCADVGISRVHLNRKLKEFGLEPPSVLIRKCRKKQAARLLADNKVNVSEVAYRIGKELNLNVGLTTHVARHTFAVRAINRGVSIYILSNLLGHSSVIATEKTYAKLLPKTLDVARSAIYGGK